MKSLFAGSQFRALGVFFDLLILLPIIFIVTASGLGGIAEALPWGLNLALVLAYFIVLPASPLHATLGKRIQGLAITDLGGNPIGIGRSAVRFAASLLSLTCLGLGYIPCYWNGKRRTLHDYAAGTVVVRRTATPAEVASDVPAPPIVQRIGKTIAFLGLLWLPPLAFHNLFNFEAALRTNGINMAAADKVAKALEAYREKHGSFPPSIATLIPDSLPAMPPVAELSTLKFQVGPGGATCWLTIVYWRRPGLLPSDDVKEYDCATKRWTVKDFGEMKAAQAPRQ